MPDPAPAPGSSGGNAVVGSIPVGAVLAGRFEIVEALPADLASERYRAHDREGGAAVDLRVFPVQVARALEPDLQRVARLTHRNLATIVALGHEAGQLVVASEALDGHDLRTLLDAKRERGEALGPTQAHTLLGHVAHALEEAYKVMAHGALSPSSIVLTRDGRVKVTDLGLARVLPGLLRRGSPAGVAPGVYAAPEQARGGPPTATSDVYSLGAILYEMCTGVAPAPPLRPPTQVRADLPPALDAVIGRAMSAIAQSRFATPTQLVAAVGDALAGRAPSSSAGLPQLSSGALPVAAGRGTGRAFNVSAAAGMEQEVERWLLQKDRLDYGPFSLKAVLDQIEKGAFSSADLVVDTETGERQKIKDHPRFADFARNAERKREANRRAQAEQAQEKVEKKKSRATLFILGAAVIVLGAGAFLYLKNRKAAEVDVLASRVGEADVDEFLKNVKLDFAQRKPAAGGAKRVSSGGGKGEFDNTMNLGDVSQGGGGDETLSEVTIDRVMMANYRKLVPCIMQERRSNPRLSEVNIEFVVRGNGSVSAVRVNDQQKGSFPGCVLGRMQGFGFPSFKGAKTIASWSLTMR